MNITTFRKIFISKGKIQEGIRKKALHAINFQKATATIKKIPNE